jgi:hypothetical protein
MYDVACARPLAGRASTEAVNKISAAASFELHVLSFRTAFSLYG